MTLIHNLENQKPQNECVLSLAIIHFQSAIVSEQSENYHKLTYRRIWDREIIGDESSDEDESFLSEKQLADILNKYPEYALLYELATLNPADGN